MNAQLHDGPLWGQSLHAAYWFRAQGFGLFVGESSCAPPQAPRSWKSSVLVWSCTEDSGFFVDHMR